MNLRRQLLLLSLLTLVLPWAGCQFIRETESALREGQQRMLAGTAQAIADSLAQFPEEFIVRGAAAAFSDDQLYGHVLRSPPLIDGYFDDWAISEESLRALGDGDGSARIGMGVNRQYLFLYVDVRDDKVVYADPGASDGSDFDKVQLVSAGTGIADNGGDSKTVFTFAPEAPGALVAKRETDSEILEETRVAAHWQDIASGYRLEARVPQQLLGQRLGVVVTDTDNPDTPGTRKATFTGTLPGRFATISPLLQSVAAGYVQPGLRLIVTDAVGWRRALVGDTSSGSAGEDADSGSGWLRRAYTALLEPGESAELASPDPSGREKQPYIRQALQGEQSTSWFRSPGSGRAVVAVAQPIWSGTVQTGVVVLQQGTEAILSLRNRALARLLNFTLLATLIVAAALLGYASWLSFRIRRLSGAALRALDDDVHAELPSGGAGDEIGDLSRSFSKVLRQLGEYNAYLRTLASKLSHEMRTPMTIVTSSLENLEHEPLTAESAVYTARARDGAERLKKILNAMSEASRVEELIENVEPEPFDLQAALSSAVAAYAGAWPERQIQFVTELPEAHLNGSPELVIQMLDKLVDNAVGFSSKGDRIEVRLSSADEQFVIAVTNPGPRLPDRMRSQLFDSMVSVRPDETDKHLGLGLFIARLIATGHGGSITAYNVESGVTFEVRLPTTAME